MNYPIFIQKELGTTSIDNSGSYGNMFDIIAHRDLNITSLDVHPDKPGYVEVWTRPGSFAEHYRSSEGWKMIANASLQHPNRMKTTPIPSSEFETVPMNASSTQAFFVRMLEANLRYTIVSLENGYPYVNSDDLDLLVGSGFYNYSFGEWELKSRQWNGVVHYSVYQQDLLQNNYNSIISSNFQGSSDSGAENVTLEKSNGNIFEVVPFKDITITSLDIHLDVSTEAVLIRVFTKSSVSEKSNWVNICETNVKGLGPARITMLPTYCFDSILIKAGKTMTFMIISSKANVISSMAQPSINGIAQMSDDLLIKTGYTIGEDFKPMKNSTVWNGIIRYYYTESVDENDQLIDVQEGHALSIGDTSWSESNNINPESSFGLIFEIHATKNVTIEGIQVMTNDTFNSHGLDYALWTKQGSCLNNISYYENIPYFEESDNWTQVSEGQLMKAFTHTQVSNNPHLILFSKNNIRIARVGIHSFYIALNFASLLSSSYNVEEQNESAEAIASDNNLQLTQSYKVSEHGKISTTTSFGLHQGAIYYSSAYVPPTQTPTAAPTPFLTNATIPHQVNYTFSVMYESARQSEVLKAIDSFIFQKLQTIFKDPTMEFLTQINLGDVKLVQVSSTFTTNFNHTDCTPLEHNVCSFVQSTVTTSFNGYITSNMLRFIILKLAPEAKSALPFKFTKYIGVVALFSEAVVSLGGVEDSQLDDNATSFYEGTVKDFLNEVMPQNVQVTDVSTTSTLQHTDASSRTRLRNLQGNTLSNKTDSLDIPTVVFGEYQPPPKVIFDNLVKESVETHAEILVQKLKKSPTFKKVEDIQMSFSTIAPPINTNSSVTIENNNVDDQISESNLAVIIGASVASIVFVIICLLLSIKSVQSKRQDQHSDDDDIYYHGDNNNPAVQYAEGACDHEFDAIAKRADNMMHNNYRH